MRYILTLTGLVFLWSISANAQTPADAIFMQQGEACVLLNLDLGRFDQYWEGENLRYNETIAQVRRNTVLPMAAIGIFEKLNFYVGLPHVQTSSSEPNGGRFQGAKGFQDLILALKYGVYNKSSEKGEFSVNISGGYSTPATNYLSDYLPYSLGFGADEWNLRAILQYRFTNGLYFRTSGAHLWRGYTEAERDYYYNNGSYYTALMDVPNAWNYQFIAGKWFLNSSLKIEAAYNGLKSTSGDDIRKYNAAQPTNKVEFDQVGISAQYYFPQIKGLGLQTYYNQIINGRNMSKSGNFGFGITYQFNFIKASTN